MPRRTSRRKELSRRYTLVALILSLIIPACTNTSKSDRSSVTESATESTALRIWWDKGFTLEEDEALQQVVSNWEKQSGNKIKLSFYTTDELPQKAQRAVRAGNPPDILMSHSAERVLNPRLAWEGKRPGRAIYEERMLPHYEAGFDSCQRF